MALLSNFIAHVKVNGIWTPYATSSNVVEIYATAQAAVDAVKDIYGNGNYKIYQEYSITKADTATA
jgi:hypothetical protein